MKKQCIVIGLGIYGMNVARKLSEEGMEVFIDAFDGIPVGDFDVGVVGIGESVSVSIITCLALKEAGVNYVIAKAGDKLHKRILEKIDVDEIVLPEEYLGVMTAKSILESKDLKKV